MIDLTYLMKKMLKKFLYSAGLFWIILVVFSACETDITLDLPKGTEKLVVEGHIEPGRPPLIMLSRSMPFFSSTSLSDLDNMFVHGAAITISDGTVTKNLIEVNLSLIPDSIIQMLRKIYQIEIDTSMPVNFSIYTSFEVFGQVGKKYTINVDADGKKVSAVTTIPNLVVPDTFWFEQFINRKNDTLYALNFRFHDPPGEENFYTYFTSTNSGPFYSPLFGTVIDDKLFNGQDVTYTFMRGQSGSDTFNGDKFGYFEKGDTVTIKYCTIDKAHYEFWSTLGSDFGGGGPFSSPVLIKSNIVNGLGIWGGYGAYYRTLYAPK